MKIMFQATPSTWRQYYKQNGVLRIAEVGVSSKVPQRNKRLDWRRIGAKMRQSLNPATSNRHQRIHWNIAIDRGRTVHHGRKSIVPVAFQRQSSIHCRTLRMSRNIQICCSGNARLLWPHTTTALTLC